MLSLSLGRWVLAGAVSATLALTAAGPAGPAVGSYEASLTGAATSTLRGDAEFGPAPGAASGGPLVITLGAYSTDGAMVLTRWNGARPAPGRYTITEEPTRDGIQALIVTGSPDHPTGVFRAEEGTLTITSSARGGLAGRFELRARGFAAGDLEGEDRELAVSGSFAASSAAPSAALSWH